MIFFLQVFIGSIYNLYYTIGQIKYTDSSDSTDSSDNSSNTVIFIAVGAVVITLILLLMILILIWCCRYCYQHKKFNVTNFTNDTEVNMYSSPAYGTHQVFSEPGLDHLYEPIDDIVEEKATDSEVHITTQLDDAKLCSPDGNSHSDTVDGDCLKLKEESELEVKFQTSDAIHGEDNDSDTGYANDD